MSDRLRNEPFEQRLGRLLPQPGVMRATVEREEEGAIETVLWVEGQPEAVWAALEAAMRPRKYAIGMEDPRE